MHPEYLMHYGVLGMKWGVRRYQNYDGSLTPAGRRRYGNLQYEPDAKSPGGPLSAHPKDYEYKKGTSLYRITQTKDEKFNTRLFLSSNPDAYANDDFIDTTQNGYVSEWKAKKNIVVAGEETINKILKKVGSTSLDTIQDDIDFMYTGIKLLQNKDFYKKEAAGIAKERAKNNTFLKKIRKKEFEKKYQEYLKEESDLLERRYIKSTKLMSDFISEAKKQGYDAIVDPMDALTSHWSPSAIIAINDLFDRVKDVKIEDFISSKS